MDKTKPENSKSIDDLSILCHRFLSGDPDGSRHFLRACAALIRQVIRTIRINTNVLSEEDLIMETIHLLFKDDKRIVREFRGKCMFKTYFFVVCRRFLLHIVKKENKMSGSTCHPEDIDALLPQRPHTEQAAVTTLQLKQKLARLDARERMFVTLYYYRDVSHEHLLRFFGWKNANAIYTFNRRILAKLK